MSVGHITSGIGLRASLLALILSASTLTALAGEFEIDWWTIDSGGTVSSEQGEWTLAGTLGQWDASGQGASSGAWFLEGGFWAVDAPVRGDNLFNDRFESSAARSGVKNMTTMVDGKALLALSTDAEGSNSR